MTENPFLLSPPPPPAFAEEPEPSKSLSAGKNSAAEQGSDIPVGWKPTASEPVPVVRCTANASTTGERCKRWSLRGTNVCTKHGGQLPSVREHSEAVVESARMRLMGMADDAVDGLEDLIAIGTAPQIRLAAIKEVLDRSGVKGGPDLSVEVSHTVSYKDEIFNRLKEIKERKEAMEKEKAAILGEDIVDAEVVDETPPTE